MSAYVVSKEHIDALVTFGLDSQPRAIGSPVRWHWPPITQEDRESVGVPGVCFTEEDVQLAQERDRTLTRETADRVGAMLWSENVRSVCYRYDEPEDADGLPGRVGFSIMDVAEYRFEYNGGWSAVEILSALGCYDYQSCEHPEWPSSEAYAFVHALQARCIDQLEGMSEGPWEINERRIKQHRASR